MIKRIVLYVIAVLACASAQAGVVVVNDLTPDGKPIIRPMNTLGDVVNADLGESEIPQVWAIDPRVTPTYEAALRAWADRAHWFLVWNLPQPYRVANPGRYPPGTFIDVFSLAANALGAAVGPVDVVFYEGSRVVTIAPLLETVVPTSVEPKKNVRPIISKKRKPE